MTSLEAKKKSRRLKDELYQKFIDKNDLLMEHVWNCIQNGAKVPLIRIRWDERKQDISMELVGS